MKNKLILFGVLFFCVAILSAQHTNIMISSSSAPEEPSIYVDPKNTDRLIAGANISNLFYSVDGGLTWTVSNLTSNSYGVW
ncbi:MAG: hypothetical protein K8R53_06565, partial [Bacteroidales bacterium]|nr:hypothetical protein [Bacteroidales bacterium]